MVESRQNGSRDGGRPSNDFLDLLSEDEPVSICVVSVKNGVNFLTQWALRVEKAEQKYHALVEFILLFGLKQLVR